MNHGSSGHPIAEETFWDGLQEGKNVDRWSGTEFLDSGPFLEQCLESLPVRRLGRRRANTIDWPVLAGGLPKLTGCREAAFTNAHDDAIGRSPEMAGPTIRCFKHVMEQLYHLRLLDLGMLFVAQCFRKILMDDLSHHPPDRCVVHEKHMIAFANDSADFIWWAVTGCCALLLQKLFDDPSVCEDGDGTRPELDSVQAAILLCPFGESDLVRCE